MLAQSVRKEPILVRPSRFHNKDAKNVVENKQHFSKKKSNNYVASYEIWREERNKKN